MANIFFAVIGFAGGLFTSKNDDHSSVDSNIDESIKEKSQHIEEEEQEKREF